MRIDLTKPNHIILFAALLPAMSMVAAYIMTLVWNEPPFWVETVSPLAAYGLLFTGFERFAWRWPLFRWLGIVPIKPLHGRWYGEQLSSYKKDNGKPTTSRVILEIEQTFSSIKARTYFKRWQSPHSASSFLPIDGELYVVMLFESEPSVHHDDRAERPHKGVARLRYLPDEDRLIGTYFNSRGSYGELSFKRSSRPIIHRFEP